MNTINKFQRLQQPIYNGQDILKNHILKKFPIHYTDDTSNYEQCKQYASQAEYVWLVDKNIEVLKTFPWYFKPKKEEYGIHLFPYVRKKSRHIKNWKRVQLVPTDIDTTVKNKQFTHNNICGIYDAYKGKQFFDLFFLSNSLEKFNNFKKIYDRAIHVSSYAQAQTLSETDMFWLVPDDITVLDNFNFDFEPDEWSYKYIHVFGNGKKDRFDGIGLFPKNYSPSEKELMHRFFAKKKEVRMLASNPAPFDYFDVDCWDEYENALRDSTTEMFWVGSRNIDLHKDLIDNFYISHHQISDRQKTHAFIHEVGDERLYNGLFLSSKNKPLTKKEIEHRFPIERIEHKITGSTAKIYDKFVIESYGQYLNALEESKTEMFWALSNNIKIKDDFKFDMYFTHDNDYDRNTNHVFIHQIDDKTLYNGLFLLSKNKKLTKKEIEHRHLIERKEWEIVASTKIKYDQLVINSYEDYLDALHNAKTEMFWGLSNNVSIDPSFEFDMYFTHDNEYDRTINHAFIHRVNEKDYYNGIFLFSKHAPVSKKEIEHRHLVKRKEWSIVASGPKQYDRFIVDNYEDYLQAIEKSSTEMFWAISSNVDTSNFNFDVYFTHDNEYDRNTNHSFAHEVNGKKYHNGIFLLSKNVSTDESNKIKNSF